MLPPFHSYFYFNEILLGSYYVLNTVLGVGGTTVNQKVQPLLSVADTNRRELVCGMSKMKTRNWGPFNRNNKEGSDLNVEVKANFSQEGTLNLRPENWKTLLWRLMNRTAKLESSDISIRRRRFISFTYYSYSFENPYWTPIILNKRKHALTYEGWPESVQPRNRPHHTDNGPGILHTCVLSRWTTSSAVGDTPYVTTPALNFSETCLRKRAVGGKSSLTKPSRNLAQDGSRLTGC